MQPAQMMSRFEATVAIRLVCDDTKTIRKLLVSRHCRSLLKLNLLIVQGYIKRHHLMLLLHVPIVPAQSSRWSNSLVPIKIDVLLPNRLILLGVHVINHLVRAHTLKRIKRS